MKNKGKLILAILIVILVIIAIVWFFSNNSKKVDTYYEVLEDGTKLNNSEKLQETKQFEGLEFSEMELNEKDNSILIQATVKNTGTSATPSGIIKLIFVDKEENELGTINWLAPELQPNDSTLLTTSAETDVINAYDFIIQK